MYAKIFFCHFFRFAVRVGCCCKYFVYGVEEVWLGLSHPHHISDWSHSLIPFFCCHSITSITLCDIVITTDNINDVGIITSFTAIYNGHAVNSVNVFSGKTINTVNTVNNGSVNITNATVNFTNATVSITNATVNITNAAINIINNSAYIINISANIINARKLRYQHYI